MKTRDVFGLAASGVLLAAANTLFTVATSRAYLSITAVLSCLAPVVVTFLARVFLGERLRPAQLIAAATVILGVILIALG